MAEEQDQSQKTEEPTPRKLEEARKKGQVASSQEVKHWFAILGALILVLAFAPAAATGMTEGMATFLTHVHSIPLDPTALVDLLAAAALDIAWYLLAPLIVLLLMAVAGGFVQHGPLLSAESLKPKLDKINPIKGLKRQFSLRALMEFVKGILKIAIVGAIATAVIMPEFDGLEAFTGLPMATTMERVWSMAVTMLVAVLAVMTVIAGLDLLYQRFEFHKQQRMTKQELKDEFKQSEGDPLVKAKLRQIRTERARRRMMAAVPDADVVITNPTHVAVAMKYDPEAMAAPVVVAKGADLIAKRIRELAEEHDVAVVENPPLARALFQAVDIDQSIPPEHYRAVAEVISYVFKLRRQPMPSRSPRS